MDKKKANKSFRVYVLVSTSRNKSIKVGNIKIGKADNDKRVPHLQKIRYAGVGWKPIKSITVDTAHAANAIEAMVDARLTSLGHKLKGEPWKNHVNGREWKSAKECYNYPTQKAINEIERMKNIYDRHVVKVRRKAR